MNSTWIPFEDGIVDIRRWGAGILEYCAGLQHHCAGEMYYQKWPLSGGDQLEAQLVMALGRLCDISDSIPIIGMKLPEIYGAASRHRLGYYKQGVN